MCTSSSIPAAASFREHDEGQKTSVTVIERSDSTVSIQEDLSYRSIADREDRALEDGATVMEYVQ